VQWRQLTGSKAYRILTHFPFATREGPTFQIYHNRAHLDHAHSSTPTMANSPSMVGYLLREFIAKTRQPLPSELHDDYCCSLCKEQYLSGFPDKSPEYPVKLPCGHIFGTDCIMK